MHHAYLPQRGVLALAACGAFALASGDAAATDLRSFQTPPNEARPRVWWHWVNGNIDNKGIKLDLEWMQRVGIGGVQVFDVDIGTAQYVDQPAAFYSPRWMDSLRYAAAQADRLGLEVAISASSGWSQTGGPWVKPEQGMKKYVWTETRVEGGRPYSGKLPAPSTVSGPFQNIPWRSQGANLPPPDGSPGAKPYVRPTFAQPVFYADAAVIAYRLPEGEAAGVKRSVTSSGGNIDAARLDDGDFAVPQALPVSADPAQPSWIQFAYELPQRVQSVTLSLGPVAYPGGAIKVSMDGVHFDTVASLPGAVHSGLSTSSGVRTFAFPERTARFVRLELGTPGRGPFDDAMGKPVQKEHTVAEFAVGTGGRVNRFEEKAGFGIAKEYDSLATPPVAPDMVVPGDSVVDLSGKMRADGSIEWNAPAGRWAILRLGYSLTGQTNDPATQDGVGLEVDKLDAAHVTSYFANLLDPLQKNLGALMGGKGLSHLLLDSWEANQQNWSAGMLAEFRKRRGYDALPWLPVLGGRVVDSAAASDKFLWDFRRTIADLLADNHYGVAADIAHQRGMKVYGEAMGMNLPTIGDGLQLKGRMDIPMGEFWDRQPHEKPEANNVSDIREAASAAHIYGKTLVAAEAFTATPMIPSFGRSPRDLKWQADQFMALGVNRIVVHTSVHQPFENRKPGVSLWRFGQNFTRNDTWAEQAGPWVEYLSRASYMLQQGRSVNDVAYFYGEGAPAAAPFGEPNRPGVPDGYGYDYVNTEVLLERATVRDGRIELPGGASYGLLVLPATTASMSLPLARKLQALVEQGATVLAPKPKTTPGLGGDAGVATIADVLWGGTDGRTVTEHRYGKGRMIWGQETGAVLEGLKLQPDYAFSRQHADSDIVATHRSDAGTEIYFVANLKPRAEKVEASFRVTGMKPELWYADSGRTAPASYRIEGGRTLVDLGLESHGSVFVVFREKTTVNAVALPETSVKPLATLTGPWKLDFAPGGGAPAGTMMSSLASWSESGIEGVKYYSGSATYRRELQAAPAWFRKGSRLLLDLGQVHAMARVKVNGKVLPLLWKAPYVADVSGVLKPGRNTLEIQVTNLWPNRLIGDAQPGATHPISFTTFKAYRPESKLSSSGLLGPVRVMDESAE